MRRYFLLPEKRIVWSACIMLNKCLSGHRLVCHWRPFPPKFPTRVLTVKLGSTSEGGQASKEGPQSPCGKFPGRMFSAWAPYGAAGAWALTGYPSFRSVYATGPHIPGAASPGPPTSEIGRAAVWRSGLGPWWQGIEGGNRTGSILKAGLHLGPDCGLRALCPGSMEMTYQLEN